MSLLGIQLNVLIGPGSAAKPASPKLLEALQEVEIKYTEDGRSGFKLTFESGRTGQADFTEDPVVGDPQLKVRNRVVLSAIFGTTPRVVADGIITVVLATPGDAGEPTLVEVAGEDLSILMDLHEKIVPHPAQPVPAVVTKIVGEYGQFGIAPKVVTPASLSTPSPVERVPVQRETDLAYIKRIKPKNYIFAIEPGPTAMVSTAYFGPSQKNSPPQPALTVNMGPDTNCSNLSFQYDSTQATSAEGSVQDSKTNTAATAKSSASPYPALSQEVPTASADVRKTLLQNTQGMTASEAMAAAQAQSDRTAEALTVTGELDASAYGDVLLAGGTVGLRGAGLSYDGEYRIKEVGHLIRPGSYTQTFTLKREGRGTTRQTVKT